MREITWYNLVEYVAMKLPDPTHAKDVTKKK